MTRKKTHPFDAAMQLHIDAAYATNVGGVRVVGAVLILSVDTETGTEARWYEVGNDHAIKGAHSEYCEGDPEPVGDKPDQPDED